MIYLGGSCSSEQRTLMTTIATALRNAGKEVYCPFELKIENAWDYPQEVWAEKVFNKDIEALNKADIFLMISPGRMSSAGTNWEQGYAYAKNKKVIVLQYTPDYTSLMTYVGSTIFINTDLNHIIDDIFKALNNIYTIGCKTVLT